jgi:hypothetical protein
MIIMMFSLSYITNILQGHACTSNKLQFCEQTTVAGVGYRTNSVPIAILPLYVNTIH